MGKYISSVEIVEKYNEETKKITFIILLYILKMSEEKY